MGNETTDQQQGSYYAPPSNMPPSGGPGYPPPGQFAPPPAPAGNKGAGKALAITALILAIVSLVLCWVPIVNNLVFFLGLLALGFAIPALVISIKKRSKAKGTSIAALIIAVVALVGVLASQAMYSSMLDGISKSISDSADGVVDTAPKDQKKADDAALALGTAAKVGGDYEVTVTGVNPNAGDVIAAVNQFNEPATGQYVLVDISVKYIGAKEGNPWIDLSTKFVGSDARQYSNTTCMAVLEKSGTSLPTLENGATADYQVCMDVPAEAVVNGKAFVEPQFSMKQDQRAYWNIK
ncbi:hypothetical protein [Arthrobacter sp. GMC3]|uniref:hypothetical protein n=1 Tax=Arthrobacter sp. GMC3 TaxID=2058894 RepID=UPI000CE2F20D|nr:hypothetical protein [Arthrobacter sp. GMC3]